MSAITLLFHILAVLAGIHGTVRTAGHGAVAAGVRVQVDGDDRAVTDSLGRYRISGVAVGEHEFLFSAPGFESRLIKMLLADSTDVALDVELTPRPAMILPTLNVIAHGIVGQPVDNPAGTATWHEAGHYRFTTGWQVTQPAGGVDVQSAIATLPGVAIRGEDATALSIHGGRGSENLFLLDGVPLMGPVHFAGAPSAINPDAVTQFDVHTGVSSARYDGALSGVIDLHTSDIAPAQLQISGTLSSNDIRSVGRVPLGTNGSLLVGARSSFRNLFGDAIGLGSSTGYQDFISTARFGTRGGTLSFVGFGSSNSLTWQSGTATDVASGAALRVSAQTVPPIGTTTALPSDAATWKSGAIGATWTQPLDARHDWNTVAWWSGSTADISLVGVDRVEAVNSGISEFGLSTELQARGEFSSLVIGGQLLQPRTWYTVTTPATDSTSLALNTDLRGMPTLGAIYGEWDLHKSQIVDFRAGLRLNTNFASSINLDPRFTVNFHLDPLTRLQVGLGRTHQQVQSMLNEENITSAIIGPTLPYASTGNAPVARADQVIASFEHQLSSTLAFSLDAYTRSWTNALTPTSTTGAFFFTGAPRYGEGTANGVTASVTAQVGRLTAHAAAGLAEALQTADGVTYHTGFEEPWSFSGDVNVRPGEHTTIQFRWTTAAGQVRSAIAAGLGLSPYPTTSTGAVAPGSNVPGTVNSLRLDGPMRVDVGVRHIWPIGGASGTRRSALSTSVRIENLFNRADPIGIMEEPGGALQLLRGTGRAAVFELNWVY